MDNANLNLDMNNSLKAPMAVDGFTCRATVVSLVWLQRDSTKSAHVFTCAGELHSSVQVIAGNACMPPLSGISLFSH
jgi:hypothetical protein